MASQPSGQTIDLNKAYGAAGSTVIAGALTKIIAHIINHKWPGTLDQDTVDEIDVVIVAAFGFLGAWLVPHAKSPGTP